MGGIATNLCCDSDMRKALVLWGHDDKIQAIAARLDSAFFAAGDEMTFRKWTSRGIAFVM